MIDAILVTEKQHGRRVLVNWRYVEAITDDDGNACIVFHRENGPGKTGDDWDMDFPGCMICVESFDEVARRVPGVPPAGSPPR